MNDLKKAIESRRSYYALSDRSPISDAEIKKLVDLAVLNVPSAFNSQSARLVLLLHEHHNKLWDIVKDTLCGMLPAENFAKTEAKIDTCFMSGYGTILFFEDQSVVSKLQEQNPSFSGNFPVWSQHTSAMHQYAMWLLLEAEGFGASLQHYNPIIDEQVAKEWNLPADWKLVAQMPFGTPTAQPGEKEYQPLEGRSLVFG